MPATRPIWKGQLRLSLVSIAVELYTATKSNAKPSFRQIHEPTGKPINYEKVVAGVGPVDKDEIMKGFEYEKGDYVLLTDDEIDAVKLETRKTLELTQFVGACEIDPIYYDKPYFVVPADELAEDAFRVIRDALRQSQKVGLGQLALRGKEYLVAIKPTRHGHAARNAALRGGDPQVRPVLLRNLRQEGRSGPAGGGHGADRQEDRQVRRQDVQGPLSERPCAS